MPGWEAHEGFVRLCFLLSLESKCRLPIFKLWAEDQRGRVGYVGEKKNPKATTTKTPPQAFEYQNVFSSFQDYFLRKFGLFLINICTDLMPQTDRGQDSFAQGAIQNQAP